MLKIIKINARVQKNRTNRCCFLWFLFPSFNHNFVHKANMTTSWFLCFLHWCSLKQDMMNLTIVVTSKCEHVNKFVPFDSNVKKRKTHSRHRDRNQKKLLGWSIIGGYGDTNKYNTYYLVKKNIMRVLLILYSEP